MGSFYRGWGFSDSPFIQTPLPPTDSGARLLVGRKEETDQIITRLCSTSKVVTIEGKNGIGKTSIYNVAAYSAFKAYLEGAATPLLIPCREPLQLGHDDTTDSFVTRAWLSIALTLVERADWLAEHGYKVEGHEALRRWIQSPLMGAVQASLNIPMKFGIGGGKGLAANTSSGFANLGLSDLVRQWLGDIFGNLVGGGVVCCIDNLELLKTSENAKKLLESIRDPLFSQVGLRWVLCGSTGIVYGLASTPRLTGYLHKAIGVKDLSVDLAGQILTSRLEAFAVTPGTTYLPLIVEDFEKLFSILHGNTRDTLSRADEYCLHFHEAKLKAETEAEKSKAFHSWLHSEAKAHLDAAAEIVRARAWKLFDQIIASDGECSPGEYEKYGFESNSALRSHVIKLERSGLVLTQLGEKDKRRKTITVTPVGWFVNYARSKGLSTLYEEIKDVPESAAELEELAAEAAKEESA